MDRIKGKSMNTNETCEVPEAVETQAAYQDDKKVSSWLENTFESFLWNSRFAVIAAVVSTLFASMALFIIGSLDIVEVLVETFKYFILGDHTHNIHSTAVGEIIGAIDLYLIAVVLLIFSFGIYELFISQIDQAENHSASKILQIHSLDQLKDKISKVIIMVLVVRYFQMVLDMSFGGPLEMLYLAGSILALSLALYFLHKGGSH